MRKQSKAVVFDSNPGRNAQTYGIARELGTDMELIHEPSVGVIGTKGDSQCYLGVQRKVEAIHAALRNRLGRGEGQMPMRLVQPEYTVATSDGMRNGTPRNALLADRTRGHPRLGMRAPECERAGGCHRRGGLRQAAGGYAGGHSRARSAGDHHVRWPDTPGGGFALRKADRHHHGLPGSGRYRCRIQAAHRARGMSRLRQLRWHVHLQHDADVHRRGRHAAVAHGRAALGRSVPPARVPRAARRLSQGHDRARPDAARHSQP